MSVYDYGPFAICTMNSPALAIKSYGKGGIPGFLSHGAKWQMIIPEEVIEVYREVCIDRYGMIEGQPITVEIYEALLCGLGEAKFRNFMILKYGNADSLDDIIEELDSRAIRSFTMREIREYYVFDQ